MTKDALKVLYTLFCGFFIMFLILMLVYVTRNVSILSQSGLPAPVYCALLSAVFIGVVIVLAVLVVGMIVLYRRLFRREIS